MADEDRATERNVLMNRLLDAVKQCQVRFGGKRELATDADSRVSCLCAAWEGVLQHGLRHNKRALSTFKQVTELTGLTGVISEIKNLETEPVFWHYVREQLTKHEHERFLHLKSITTEAGRGRAWLRSSLNEASLEKYMHSLIGNDTHLVQFYEDGAFLRDQECSSMLPMMAAGLTSILFAINIDNEDLNTIIRAQGLDLSLNPVVEGISDHVDREKPVFAPEFSDKRKDKKKRKKIPMLISFDDDSKLKSVKKQSAPHDLPPVERLNLNQGLVTGPLVVGPLIQRPLDSETLAARAVVSDHVTNNSDSHDEFPRLHEQDNLSQRSSSLTNLYTETDDFESAPSYTNNDCLPGSKSTEDRHRPLPIRDDSFSDTTSIYASAPTSPLLSNITNQFTADDDVPMPLTPSYESFVPKTTSYETLVRQNTLQSVDSDSSGLVHAADTRWRRTSSSPSETSRVSVSSTGSASLPPSEPSMLLIPVVPDNDVTSLSVYPSCDVTSLSVYPAYTRESDAQSMSSADSVPLYPSTYGEMTEELSRDTTRDITRDIMTRVRGSTLTPLTTDYNRKYSLIKNNQGLRTAGDGSHAPDTETNQAPDIDSHAPDQAITSQDLRQAVVAMMMRKDEVEEQNRSLRTMLDQQIEICAGIRAELDDTNSQQRVNEEKNHNKITALSRDNDLLKHQLKKYVNAVQLLRREGISAEGRTGIHLDDVQPAIPGLNQDYSNESSEYEKKLIQVAEMHGELMEFNERLHIALNAKEQRVEQLTKQLEELRGPLPRLEEAMAGTDAAAECSVVSRPLINIWIPSVFFAGTGSDAHHTYQVYIRIGDEEWNVYRRYQQFYDLHVKLKKSHPIVATFDFPKKKVLGNKDKRFVEDRRKKLQMYVRLVVNLLIKSDTSLNTNPNKQKLVQILSILDDSPQDPKKLLRSARGGATILPANRSRDNDSTPALYTGL